MVRDLSNERRRLESERAETLARADVTANAVLDRVALELGLKQDVQLARLFGASKTTVSTWRSRNRIPFEELVYLHLTRRIDLMFFIFGLTFNDYQSKQISYLREKTTSTEVLLTKLEEALGRNRSEVSAGPHADDPLARLAHRETNPAQGDGGKVEIVQGAKREKT